MVKMVKDISRLVINPILNALSFFTMYINIDKIEASLVSKDNWIEKNSETTTLNKYIIRKAFNFQKKFNMYMSNYDSYNACKEVRYIFNVLNNWYIRRNRKLFWETITEDNQSKKKSVYNVLYTVLYNISITCASILPLISEYIWQSLHPSAKSIHLFNYNNIIHKSHRDDLEVLSCTESEGVAMDKLMEICTSILAIRNENFARVRQPLSEASIYISSYERSKNSNIWDYFFDSKNQIMNNILQDEVNIKKVNFISNIDGIAEYQIKPNFNKIAQRLKDKMKQIISSIKQNKWQEGQDFEGNNYILVNDIRLNSDEYEKQLKITEDRPNIKVLEGNDAVITLNLEITPELREEGIRRDIIRALQNMRKNADLNVTDHKKVFIASEDIIGLAALHKDYDHVCKQTLLDIITISRGGAINENEHSISCVFGGTELTDEQIIEQKGFNIKYKETCTITSSEGISRNADENKNRSPSAVIAKRGISENDYIIYIVEKKT